jgi:hypothetical protein
VVNLSGPDSLIFFVFDMATSYGSYATGKERPTTPTEDMPEIVRVVVTGANLLEEEGRRFGVWVQRADGSQAVTKKLARELAPFCEGLRRRCGACADLPVVEDLVFKEDEEEEERAWSLTQACNNILDRVASKAAWLFTDADVCAFLRPPDGAVVSGDGAYRHAKDVTPPPDVADMGRMGWRVESEAPCIGLMSRAISLPFMGASAPIKTDVSVCAPEGAKVRTCGG